MATVDELDAEQAHIHHAYACLERMRERTRRLLADAPEDPDLLNSLSRRVAALTDGGRPLCFGRIDTDGHETFHIGRRHVEDGSADPVVVEWRAPIAVPFYRATIDEPLGLERRRQFVVDGRTLISLADDLFGDTALTDTGPRVRARDALLAELERARTGQMLDIVATIQAEQDVVIRAQQPGVLCVQGGPGTGKTAIGLHRAAFLLFGNDGLARDGVLVIGPNRTFLRYIAQVLPSLGEAAVVQTTLADLVPESPVRAVESDAIARLKGDARMAEVLRAALAAQRGRLDDDVELRFESVRLRLDAAAANDLAARLAGRRISYAAGRTALRDRLVQLLFEQFADALGRGAAGDYTDATRGIGASREFRAALDRLWPSVSAAGLVRDLWTKPARLRAASVGILDDHERALLARKAARGLRNEPWTEPDGPIVDAAVEFIDGARRTYGHVVVDEAQDLSPMQALMLARRCPIGSMTILGDLAQGTGVWARDDWADLVAHLPTPDGAVYQTLGLGYRAPGRVLALANRMLPEIAPDLAPTESIRPGRFEPRFVAVDHAEHLAEHAAKQAALLVGDGMRSIGVIVPAGTERDLERALAAGHLDTGDALRQGLDHQVTVLPALAAKGLEFDAVVVVEPAAILDDAPRGLRLVYIAITRPTQALVVVHHQPLPRSLAVTA